MVFIKLAEGQLCASVRMAKKDFCSFLMVVVVVGERKERYSYLGSRIALGQHSGHSEARNKP